MAGSMDDQLNPVNGVKIDTHKDDILIYDPLQNSGQKKCF